MLAFTFIVFTGIDAEYAQHGDAYIPDTTGSDFHGVKLAIIERRKNNDLATESSFIKGPRLLS